MHPVPDKLIDSELHSVNSREEVNIQYSELKKELNKLNSELEDNFGQLWHHSDDYKKEEKSEYNDFFFRGIFWVDENLDRDDNWARVSAENLLEQTAINKIGRSNPDERDTVAVRVSD